MSGGEIVILPVGLVLAPIAAVAIGAGLAAALAVRAAAAGTEAAGRALEQLGDEMARKADAQHDLEIRGRLWEVAAGSVAQTNMELRLLTARAQQAGVPLALPRPIDLTGCELAGTHTLVVQTQKTLAGARAKVEQAEAARERRHLLAKLPAPAGDSPTAAELLAQHEEVLARRLERTTVIPRPVAPRKVDPSHVQAEIEKILLRLDADAAPADREEALVGAAHAARQKSIGSSRTYLEALGRKVEKEINPRVARRREAAGLLDALEHPVIADMISEVAPPRPPCLGSIERLRAVVRGDEDLTDVLRRDGRSAVGWAQMELDRRRLLDGVAEAFAGLGYSVTTGMGVKLSVSRDVWRGYTADVWVDEAGRVQSHLVQEAPDAAGEAARCADLNESMRRVGVDLTRRGIAADVHVPGQLKRAVKRYRPGTPQVTTTTEDTVPMTKQIDSEEDR